MSDAEIETEKYRHILADQIRPYLEVLMLRLCNAGTRSDRDTAATLLLEVGVEFCISDIGHDLTIERLNQLATGVQKRTIKRRDY